MSYSIPTTLAEAVSLAERDGNSAFIAGGTDLMVRRSLGLDTARHLIDLSSIAELHGIHADGDTLSIGAATTLAELAANPIIRSRFSAIAEAALSIASPPIRNSATVAGNLLCENRCIYYDQSEFWQTAAGGCLKCGAEVCIATGSAKHCYSVFISDLAPVLICLGAHVEFIDHLNTSRLSSKPVEWLYTGEGMNPHTISKGDILTRIVLRIPAEEEQKIFFYKIRPRASVDFTNLTVAMRLAKDGMTIAASGIGPAPAVLRNAAPHDVDAIAAALLKQSQIIDNLSYQRPYRKEMIRETIMRGITALFPLR